MAGMPRRDDIEDLLGQIAWGAYATAAVVMISFLAGVSLAVYFFG